jgi:hypothetical protein
MMDSASTTLSFSGAPAVARGVSRLFLRNQIMVQPEVSLRNNRRADLMGLTIKGEIIIVEIKCSRADLLPERAGLIIADAYDAEIARPAALVPVAPARRKTETQRLARLAMRRLMGTADPDLILAGIDVE